jgi:flagellar protein FlaG
MNIDPLGSPTSATAPAAARAAARTPAGASDSAAAKPAPSLAQVNAAVSRLNQAAQAKSQGLEFSVDSDSKRTVVKVVDQSTKEVLRQIPTPEALELAKALEAASRTGLLIQQTA